MDGLISDMKRNIASKFEMKDLGMMHYFLGMQMWQNVDGISLGEGKYAVVTSLATSNQNSKCK